MRNLVVRGQLISSVFWTSYNRIHIRVSIFKKKKLNALERWAEKG